MLGLEKKDKRFGGGFGFGFGLVPFEAGAGDSKSLSDGSRFSESGENWRADM